MRHRLLHLQALFYEAHLSCFGRKIVVFYLLEGIFGVKRSIVAVSDCFNLEKYRLGYFTGVNCPRSMKIRSIHPLTPFHHRRQP
jgi:hypothetical protein